MHLPAPPLRTRRARWAALALALSACGTDAPPTGSTNPPGETPLLQRGVPAPWGQILTGNTHEVGLDRGISRAGASAYVRSIDSITDTSAFAGIVQQLSAASYRGKRVRLSGFVRTDSVARGKGAGLWMRVDAADRTVAFDNMIDFGRARTGSTPWSRLEIVLDVPGEAVGLAFGLLLSGGGIVRADDLALEVVDASVLPTRQGALAPDGRDSVAYAASYQRLAHFADNLDFESTSPPFNLAYEWLLANSRPFDTEMPGSGSADLAELGVIVGGARVAAFGEATHGTREFFQMKHRALEYLVQQRGFTHFLIEASMPEARALDRYVRGGVADPARLLAGLHFWTWNTQEVLDLILWMRGYNERTPGAPLRFVGFDMQYPHVAIDSVRTMLARAAPVLQGQAAAAFTCLEGTRGPNGQLQPARYAAVDRAVQDQCAAGLRVLADTLAGRRAQWRVAFGADDADWLEQYLTLVRQWERMARTTDGTAIFRERDRSMADNVLWTAAREPQARLFVWAHNGHVTRRVYSMGYHLAAALGEEYRNVAFTFGGGRFNAVTLLPSGAFGALELQYINNPNVGTLEQYFSATLAPRLIFDARRATSGATGTHPFNRRLIPMRSIGSVYSPANPAAYYEIALLPVDYDGVIWFVNTRESRLLPFP